MGTDSYAADAPIRHVKVWDAAMKPKGFEQITVLTTTTTLTVPAGARRALILTNAQDVRFRDDGTAPTAAIGLRLPKDTLFWYTGDLATVQFIEIAIGASMDVSYYGDE